MIIGLGIASCAARTTSPSVTTTPAPAPAPAPASGSASGSASASESASGSASGSGSASDSASGSASGSRQLPLEIHPQGDVLVACDASACLALWVEAGAVLAASLDPASTTARTVVPADARRLVRVAALVPHRRGFAFLRYVSRSFEVAELELRVVDRAGAEIATVALGTMYGNGSPPALAIAAERGLVGLPATSTRVDFLDLERDVPGARRRTSGAHTSTPGVAHDGRTFVETWLDWDAREPIMRVRRHDRDSASRALPYLSRASLVCARGRCVLAGERRRDAIVVTIDDAAIVEHPLGVADVLAVSAHLHAEGALVVARTATDVRLAVVSPAGIRPLAQPGPIPPLHARGDDRYLGVTIEDPSGFEPMSYPCPGDESSTCMDVAPYQRFRLVDLVIR